MHTGRIQKDERGWEMRTLYMKVIYPSALPCSARLRLRHRNSLGKTTSKEKKGTNHDRILPSPPQHPTNWSWLVATITDFVHPQTKSEERCTGRGGREEKKTFSTATPSFTAFMLSLLFPLIGPSHTRRISSLANRKDQPQS